MSNVISFEVVENTAVITFNNPPVNALGHAVRSGIVDALDKANNNVNVKAIILIGGGRTFPAGADITCLLYTSPSPRDKHRSRMPSSA